MQETKAILSDLSKLPSPEVLCCTSLCVKVMTIPALIVTGSLPASIYLTLVSYSGAFAVRFNCMTYALLPVTGSLLSVFHLKPALVKAFLTSGSA